MKNFNAVPFRTWKLPLVRRVFMLKDAFRRYNTQNNYGCHLTAFIIPSHLQKFKLCMPNMQVVPAQSCVCYVNIGVHWYREVTQESLILDSKFKISSFRITKVIRKTRQTQKWFLLDFLEAFWSCFRISMDANVYIINTNELVQRAYQAYTVRFFCKWEGIG